MCVLLKSKFAVKHYKACFIYIYIYIIADFFFFLALHLRQFVFLIRKVCNFCEAVQFHVDIISVKALQLPSNCPTVIIYCVYSCLLLKCQ